jgi:urea transport system permease protein
VNASRYGEPCGSRISILAIIELGTLLTLLGIPIALWSRPELVTLATNVLILAMLAMSFDLCWGYAGIMSFGQALFFGTSGYVAAVIGRDFGFSSLWGSLPLAVVVSLSLSLPLAAILLLGRTRSSILFVAIGTLTGSYAAERLASGWQYVGAGNGLSSIKLLQVGALEMVEGIPFYCLVLSIFTFFYLGCRVLVRSQFGLVLAAIKQDQERLAYLGYRVQIYKIIMFTLAGVIAGIAGMLFAYHQGFIGPGNLGPGLSTTAALYSLFGGPGTLIGALLGTATVEVASYILSDVDAIRPVWPLILGLLLLLVVVMRSGGLLGFLVPGRELMPSYGPRHWRVR